MPLGFKVRLSDGSAVGPLDIDTLRSWYEQELIDRDTFVMVSTGRRWQRLAEVTDIGHQPRRRSKKEREARTQALAREAARVPPPRHGRLLAGGVLISGAVGAIAAWFLPGSWRPDLQPVPWREIAYVQVLLALTALHGAEWTRKFTRTVVCLAAFAVFPLVGLAIAQGVALDAYLVLASAWLVASGLFFLLAPSLPWMQLAAAVGAVLMGAYGLVRFGVVMGAAASGSTYLAGLTLPR